MIRVGAVTRLSWWNRALKFGQEYLSEAVNHPNQDPAHGIGGIHPAWDIIIPKLDSKSQMKISQLNQHLAEIVKMNAESKLRKYRRQIQENKYM